MSNLEMTLGVDVSSFIQTFFILDSGVRGLQILTQNKKKKKNFFFVCDR